MHPPTSPLWIRVSRWLGSHPRAVTGVVVLLLLLTLFRVTTLQEWFQLDHLRVLLRDHRLEGIALFVGLFVLGNLLHVPGWIFVAAAVVVLGRLTGGLATYIAASLACAITFVLVRWFGGNAIQKLPYPFAQKLLVQLLRHPLRNTLVLRTVFQTLPTLNYALALSGMRFRTYMAGTLLGLPVPIAGYCFFFDAIARQMHLAAY